MSSPSRIRALVLVGALCVAAAGGWWLYRRPPPVGPEPLPAPATAAAPRTAAPVTLVEPEPPPEPEPGPELAGDAGEDPPVDGGRQALEPSAPSVPVLQVAGPAGRAPGEHFRGPNELSGRVVDLSGEPRKAHVAMVEDGGSFAMSTQGDGTFKFQPNAGDLTLLARTEDGQVGVLTGIQLAQGEGRTDLSITVQPGAKVELALDGMHDSVRCALVSDGVLFNDFTLRKEKETTETVPPGPLLVRLYSGSGADRVVHEERSLILSVGDEQRASFWVDR